MNGNEGKSHTHFKQWKKNYGKGGCPEREREHIQSFPEISWFCFHLCVTKSYFRDYWIWEHAEHEKSFTETFHPVHPFSACDLGVCMCMSIWFACAYLFE